MKSYRLLVFDWDGTLMNSKDKIVNCYLGAALDNDVKPPVPEQVVQLIGLSIEDSFSRLYPRNSPQTNARLARSYGEHWRHKDATPMTLFSDVEEGLERLETAGYVLSIATGKSANGLQRALCETGLIDRFAYTRCGDQGFPKPHPEMLQNILAYTNTSCHEAIMIGDTTFDLDMAARAGMDGWGVTYGSHSAQQLRPLSSLDPARSFGEIVEVLC